MKRKIAILLIIALILSFIPAIIVNAADTTATITFDDLAKQTSFSTSQQVWEENGITVTNKKGAGSDVASYANPVRFYKNATLIIEHPAMTKIEFTCSSNSYATALKNSITGATASGKVVTVTFPEPTGSFTITLSGGQVRMNSLTVTSSGDETPTETTPAETTPTETTPAETTPTETTPTETTPTNPTQPVVGGGYVKITSLDQLTTGKYILVASNGVAMTVYDNGWVLPGTPVVDGDTITTANAEGFIWDLTVTDGTVTFKDANGVFIKPKTGNNNGVLTGEYSLTVTCTDGTFRFSGAGSDTTSMAYNAISGQEKFRFYKNGTIDGDTTHYLANFTLYKLVEGGASEPDTILVGASYNVHLIEPWALRVKVQFAKNTVDNLIPVSSFTDYGAYAIIGNKFDGTTAEDLMNDPDAVKYTKADGNITAEGTTLTFDFYDGLYSYNLGENVYWVAYFVTAEGTHYTTIQTKSLTDVADALLGNGDVSDTEKAVLNSMKDLKDAVIALRGEDANLGNVYAPGTANTGLGDRNTGYQFGTSSQIKLIEPWGVRVRVLMREKTAAAGVYADYDSADDYGVIFFHDKTGKYAADGMTAAQMSAETDAKVYSKKAGNAAIVANGVTAVYDQGIYTYDLDTVLYCLPYIVVDGEYYYPANATCWNLLGEMTEYSQDTDLTAEERAVFSAMLEMYENVQEHIG